MLTAVGRRLGNAEIAAGFGVSVRTVETHIAALRRKLCATTRAELVAAAGGRRRAAVPLPQNSFVGRDADLAAVRALLAGQRWVTVVGPAGCGKSRLARELAAAGARTPVVAELAGTAPGDVPTAVAAASGLPGEPTADPVPATARALDAEPTLLVLDDCDRVAAAVVRLLGELVPAARQLTVLATCRAPVGGSDEAVHLLAPLPVEGGEEPAAVRLLLDRARVLAAQAPAAGADRRSVRLVCARVDGLPLGIELAAARLRHLRPAELAERLCRGTEDLGCEGGDRHDTLRAAFAWTWDLLGEDDRRTLGRLAALPGTFGLDRAEAVAGPGAAAAVLRLADRSMLAPAPVVDGRSRYRVLTSLRCSLPDGCGAVPSVRGVPLRSRPAAAWPVAGGTVDSGH